ncbi:MAG: NAD-dependent epimerase/dehydratase family protein [Anaerolineae bacterium]|nr:NAD-dependent epimerase/dehydratase family protein [Anaerolineae bacterium]
MQALITGGTGFVGSHIARLLHERGQRPRILHRATSRLDALAGLAYESAIGDVTEPDALRRACAGCDVVFHVAAVADYWRADPAWMVKVNVAGTASVLAAARAAGVRRVVFTSSAAAVGLREDRPADEQEPFNLPVRHFPYGYSKVQAEQQVAQAVAAGQDVVTVNPVVILGPGDLNMISGTFIVQTARLQWLTPWTSGGVAVTDVRDVAAWHLAAAEHGRSGERYLLSTANYPYRDWFNLIADAAGVARPIVYTPDALLPLSVALVDALRALRLPLPLDANQVRLGGRKVYFDPAKAWRELGPPRYDMAQSVSDTFRWYVAQGLIRPDALSRLIGAAGRILGQRPHPRPA